MTENVSEKVYCYEKPHDNSVLWATLMNQKESPLETAALMNGGMGNQWNNPFMYLVWMFMMRWMNGNGWGNGADMQAQNETQRQISNLQGQMLDNHNSDLIMAGIKGNEGAIREASTRIGCDMNALNSAICNVRASVDNVAAQTGFSAERVINAVNMGDAGITSKLQDCCCQTKTAILEQGYQNQLANERQTGILGSKIDNLSAQSALSNCQQTNSLTNTMNANNYGVMDRMRDLGNGISQGFASTAYESQRQTCDIINAINASQQKTADLLNNHWQSELAGKLQDAKFEVSQLKQNQYIASILNGNSGCSCNTGCGCGI